MSVIRIAVEADINLSEDPNRVKRAIENLFLNPHFKILNKNGGSLLLAECDGEEGLKKLHDILRKEKIRGAARRILNKGLQGETITFFVNKQAAYVNRLSFCEPVAESPLGPIKIEIICDDPASIIDWLAPNIY